jgi:hypothetical protein
VLASRVWPVLQSKYCLVPRGDMPDSGRLYDAMACECIPILISDRFHGAFADVVNYSAFSLRVPEARFVADPIGSLRSVTAGADVGALRRALKSEGSRVLWLHRRSRLPSLVTEALHASEDRTRRLTLLTSWQ